MIGIVLAPLTSVVGRVSVNDTCALPSPVTANRPLLVLLKFTFLFTPWRTLPKSSACVPLTTIGVTTTAVAASGADWACSPVVPINDSAPSRCRVCIGGVP